MILLKRWSGTHLICTVQGRHELKTWPRRNLIRGKPGRISRPRDGPRVFAAAVVQLRPFISDGIVVGSGNPPTPHRSSRGCATAVCRSAESSPPPPWPPRCSSAVSGASAFRTCTRSAPISRRLVGAAFTLRYMPAREDLNKLDVFRDRSPSAAQGGARIARPVRCWSWTAARMPARRRPAPILMTRLMQRGVAGVVTDGGFRDSRRDRASSAFPPFTTGRARRPTSRCIRRSRSTARSAAATRRCFPATWFWRRRRRHRDPRRISPTKSPMKPSR